jgi:hypothetical protein
VYSNAIARSVVAKMKCLCLLAALSVVGSSVGCGAPRPIDRSEGAGSLGNELLDAVKNGAPAAVATVLKRGADPNFGDESSHSQETALTLACAGDSVEVLQLLIRSGADPNRRPGGVNWTRTPLMVAAERGDDAMVRALLAAGAHVHAREGLLGPEESSLRPRNALGYAIGRGAPDVVRELLLAGATVEPSDVELAVVVGQEPVLRLLLRTGPVPAGLTPALAVKAPPATRKLMAEVLGQFVPTRP